MVSSIFSFTTLPNRYAIESDDSEDDVTLNAYPNASKQPKRPKESYSADFVWNEEARTLPGRKTYVAIGQAGLIWASGTALNAAEAQVRINEEPVSPKLWPRETATESHSGRKCIHSVARSRGRRSYHRCPTI
jgi:hypothetical protein